MSASIQAVLVALIVVGCTIFSAWRLMSPRARLRSLELAAPVMARLTPGLLSRLRSRTLGQLNAGCGACSHNKVAMRQHGGKPT